ncbi:MAG: membrane protein insertase YidC, partial [Thermodesulfobacteriota bacterium]
MDKRAILAIILTFFVIFGWSILQSKLFPPEKSTQEATKGPSPSIEEKEIPQKTGIPKKESKPLKEKIPIKTFKPIVKKEVIVETQNFIAVLTSEEARLKHFRLKKYKDRVEQSDFVYKLVNFFKSLFGKEVEEIKEPKPLDLINTEDESLPLGTPIKGFPSEGGWEVEGEPLQLLTPGERGEVTFVKALENNLKVFKRYRFNSEKYSIDLEVEVKNASQNELTTQVGIEWIGKVELEKLADEENKDYGLKYAFFKNQKVERKDLGGRSSAGCTPGCGSVKRRIEPFNSSFQGEIGWYSFEGEYFTALVIPPPSEKNLTLTVKGSEKNILEATLLTSPFS